MIASMHVINWLPMFQKRVLNTLPFFFLLHTHMHACTLSTLTSHMHPPTHKHLPHTKFFINQHITGIPCETKVLLNSACLFVHLSVDTTLCIRLTICHQPNLFKFVLHIIRYLMHMIVKKGIFQTPLWLCQLQTFVILNCNIWPWPCYPLCHSLKYIRCSFCIWCIFSFATKYACFVNLTLIQWP